jgi:hypothetical protein
VPVLPLDGALAPIFGSIPSSQGDVTISSDRDSDDHEEEETPISWKCKADKGKEKVEESPKRPPPGLQLQELGSILSETRGSFPQPGFPRQGNPEVSARPVAPGAALK